MNQPSKPLFLKPVPSRGIFWPNEGNFPIHLHFHDISQTNTTDDVFYYDNGVNTPVACQYHTLHLLTLEDVFEAALPAV